MVPINIVMRAERACIEGSLSSLIDDSALVAWERHTVLLILEEVLAKLGTDVLKNEADMSGNRIIAQDGMFGLNEVTYSQCGEEGEDTQRKSKIQASLWIAPH